jgi:hypothetical protein
MASAFVLVDVECKAIASLSSDQRLRFGAR